jgi:hypothetical protein
MSSPPARPETAEGAPGDGTAGRSAAPVGSAGSGCVAVDDATTAVIGVVAVGPAAAAPVAVVGETGAGVAIADGAAGAGFGGADETVGDADDGGIADGAAWVGTVVGVGAGVGAWPGLGAGARGGSSPSGST